ncbi:MAG: hypothetical protein JKY65_33820 [Planctomycetes bacterium]|nr:hypothetical protein [Planctomycetota bacterium]
MADERYKKFLGIEPSEDVPNYYELLGIATEERDADVLEKAYKTQIRKLQQIRTSKDAGFIEFLKEEMRSARRILAKPEKRKEYDESLVEDALEGFKGFVGSLMVMGHINKSLYDTMVSRGVADGLAEAQAVRAIEALAKEHGATLEKTDPAGTPPPAPAGQEESYDGSYDDLGYDYVEEDEGADYDYEDSGTYDQGDGGEDPGYGDQAPDSPQRGEAVLQAPPRGERPPPPPVQAHAQVEPEFQDEEALPDGPWYRGVGEQPPPWGRRAGSEFQIQRRVRKSGGSRAPRTKEFDAAVRFYNLGAALAKVASDVHEKLRLYFPPGKPPAKMINGIPAMKVLDTEQSTYRECLKKFQGAMDRVGDSQDSDADLVRVRSTQSVTLVRGILDEIKQHKLRLMGGLPSQEETRAWQEFVGHSRPPRLTRVID